jgi:hypothetical protein
MNTIVISLGSVFNKQDTQSGRGVATSVGYKPYQKLYNNSVYLVSDLATTISTQFQHHFYSIFREYHSEKSEIKVYH